MPAAVALPSSQEEFGRSEPASFMHAKGTPRTPKSVSDFHRGWNLFLHRHIHTLLLAGAWRSIACTFGCQPRCLPAPPPAKLALTNACFASRRLFFSVLNVKCWFSLSEQSWHRATLMICHVCGTLPFLAPPLSQDKDKKPPLVIELLPTCWRVRTVSTERQRHGNGHKKTANLQYCFASRQVTVFFCVCLVFVLFHLA